MDGRADGRASGRASGRAGGRACGRTGERGRAGAVRASGGPGAAAPGRKNIISFDFRGRELKKINFFERGSRGGSPWHSLSGLELAFKIIIFSTFSKNA